MLQWFKPMLFCTSLWRLQVTDGFGKPADGVDGSAEISLLLGSQHIEMQTVNAKPLMLSLLQVCLDPALVHQASPCPPCMSKLLFGLELLSGCAQKVAVFLSVSDLPAAHMSLTLHILCGGIQRGERSRLSEDSGHSVSTSTPLCRTALRTGMLSSRRRRPLLRCPPMTQMASS